MEGRLLTRVLPLTARRITHALKCYLASLFLMLFGRILFLVGFISACFPFI